MDGHFTKHMSQFGRCPSSRQFILPAGPRVALGPDGDFGREALGEEE